MNRYMFKHTQTHVSVESVIALDRWCPNSQNSWAAGCAVSNLSSHPKGEWLKCQSCVTSRHRAPPPTLVVVRRQVRYSTAYCLN